MIDSVIVSDPAPEMKFGTPLVYKVQRFHQLAGMQNLQAPFLLVPVAGKFALLECCPQHLLPVIQWPTISSHRAARHPGRPARGEDKH